MHGILSVSAECRLKKRQQSQYIHNSFYNISWLNVLYKRIINISAFAEKKNEYYFVAMSLIIFFICKSYISSTWLYWCFAWQKKNSPFVFEIYNYFTWFSIRNTEWRPFMNVIKEYCTRAAINQNTPGWL